VKVDTDTADTKGKMDRRRKYVKSSSSEVDTDTADTKGKMYRQTKYVKNSSGESGYRYSKY
jgi:hypothetical protein